MEDPKMLPNIDELKQKMKDEYAEKVEEYFAQYEELKKRDRFDIEGIEALLGKGIAAAKEIMVETSEKIMKSELQGDSISNVKKNHV